MNKFNKTMNKYDLEQWDFFLNTYLTSDRQNHSQKIYTFW